MGIRPRGVAMLLSGSAFAALPFLAGQQPAGAAVSHDNRSASLMFLDTAGHSVTCTLTDNSTHNTDQPNNPFALAEGSISGGSECSGFLTVVINFNDVQGTLRGALAEAQVQSGQTVPLFVSGAYTSINTSATIRFDSCDVQMNENCVLGVTTSPK